MIPLRDDNPSRITPYVMYALVVLNIVAYLVDITGGGNYHGIPVGALWDFTMIPKQISVGDPNLPAQLLSRGQGFISIPHPSPSPVWITIFTSMFLHANLLHIGGNMLYLWIFGNNVEDVLGHWKFLSFYLIGGLAAAAAHVLSDPSSQVPVVGASGAIAAVLGAYMVLFPKARVLTLIFLGFFVTTVSIPAVVLLGYWIFIQVFSTTMSAGPGQGTGGVAYWAHIGGFAAGALGILLLGGRKIVRDRR